jgi:hypothetical protein
MESCSSTGCCSVEMNATLFLNEVRDKKMAEAKEYCTPKARLFIDSCIKHSILIEVPRVYNVACKVKGEHATCTFCCINGAYTSKFIMIKTPQKRGAHCNNWLVDDLSLIFLKNNIHAKPH